MSCELFRSTILHTPRNPLTEGGRLESFEDGALVVEDGRILACGDFSALRREHPEATLHNWRGGFLLPGFVDTHVHYPQLRVIGSLGRPLLDWLRESALPEESRLADSAYARGLAREFLRALASQGTTTALVFGSHFAEAEAILFEEALASGLRISSGLVLADRHLLPELHTTPDRAYRESSALIARYHGQGGLAYAVTPRYALSCTEPMLEVCRTLLRENPQVLFQTHLNENVDEIAAVLRAFPRASDYLDIYERHDLAGRRSVLAHNVHGTDSEMRRLAALGASVAHCPCSNAALGSGIFPLRRHLAAGVRVALGTDVGAGTGFGMPKEALQAYLLQRLAPDGQPLSPASLLYLATRAGAEALGADAGDFTPGRPADFVYLRPPEQGVLASVLRNASSAEAALAAIFTLAGADCVAATHVLGKAVWNSPLVRHSERPEPY